MCVKHKTGYSNDVPIYVTRMVLVKFLKIEQNHWNEFF